MFAVSLFALAATAADASAQARSTTKGFHLGAALNGSSVTVEVDDVDDEVETGPGLSLTAGYNFTRQLGLLLHVSGASIDSEGGGSYALGHADLAGRLSFPNPSGALVPYLELGFTGISLADEVDGDDVTVSGQGFTGAVGLNYFFNPKLALDLNLRFTGGELDTVEMDGNSVTSDEGLDTSTARVNIGVSWFPRGN